MVNALILPPDQNAIPEPEIFKGRDDDLDGPTDEDYIYSESCPTLTLISFNHIEPLVAPKILLLPNQTSLSSGTKGKMGFY